MREWIRKRHLLPIFLWFVCYMGLFLYLEVCEPEEVHLISCPLDYMIPHIPAFIYAYLSWFLYIPVCAYLAIRYLGDADYKKAVLILTTGMDVFLVISYLWPTGLDLREGIVYHTETLSGWLMQFVQTVDTPKSVFPSMHVYVTLVLQYTLELQKGRLPAWGVRLGRCVAALIVLSTMFTKQHSVVDVFAACVMFAAFAYLYERAGSRRQECKIGHGQTDENRLQ